jgi:hypothetical protein
MEIWMTCETVPPLAENFARQRCEAWTVTLYIGGCAEDAKRILARMAADVGACWSVEPTEFIYSGGRERGVIVRQIAYARFPASAQGAMVDMAVVGERLARDMGQGSFSVVGPVESVFWSRRKGG